MKPIFALFFLILDITQAVTLDDFTFGATAKVKTNRTLWEQGYDFVEPPTKDLLLPDNSDEVFLAHLKKVKEVELSVPIINSFISIKICGPERDHEAGLAYAKKIFARAKQAGIEKIVFGSGSARSAPKGYPSNQHRKEFVDFLKLILPEAKKLDLVISLEPLTDDILMPTIDSAASICEEINEPAHLGITADFWHMMNNDDAAKNITKFAKHIKHIHLAERQDRTPPGVHQEDFHLFWMAMLRAGYTGPVTIEAAWWKKPISYEEHGGPALAYTKAGLQKAIDTFNEESSSSE